MSSLFKKIALVSMISTGSGLAAANDLTVVAFGGSLQEAFEKTYFKPFEQSTGKKIVRDSYGGGLAKIKGMVEAGDPTWDVVQIEEADMELACEQGLLEEIKQSGAPNIADVVPENVASCGVGAIGWSEVMTYDDKKFGADGPKSWVDFWNVKKWPGKRGLRKQARMTLEIALLADGVAPADVYKVLGTKAGQDRAFAKMDELKPYIQWWETGAQPLEWLAAGNVTVTAAFNGRIAIANQQGSTFPLIWNQQIYGVDYWSIIKGSKNLEGSYALLNYMLSPQAQTNFAHTIPYGIVNRKALAELDAKTLDSLPSAPTHLKDAVHLDTAFWINYEEDLMNRFTNWASK